MVGMRVRVPVALAAVGSMLLVACGGGSTKVAPTTASAASTATTGSPTGSSTAPSVPLTASFRGVTATTIKIGIIDVDFKCIAQFLDTNQGDQQAIDQVFIDDLNAHGGVLGRKIVPVFRTYCPIGNAQALAACTAFTEDDAVFAVMGLLYDDTGDADLCLTRDHQTIYEGFELNQSWVDQSPPGLMVSTDITAERRSIVLLNLLRSQGKLTGKKIATFTDSNADTTVKNVVKPALDKMGIPQGSPAVVTIVGSDTTAAQAQLDAFIEKWKSEGVNAIWLAGQYVGNKQFVEKIKSRMPDVQLFVDGVASAGTSANDEVAAHVKPNPYDGMITSDGWTDDEYWASPALQQCVKLYEAKTGQTVVAPDNIKPGPDGKRVLIWVSIRDFCGDLSLFKQVATKAGPDLTNATWVNAISNFGEINIGIPYASLHTGKYDATDSFRLEVFDSTYGPRGGFRPLSPIEDASK
jgi:ABC-type branched-subunit amino acid transport system substrate-binding protein